MAKTGAAVFLALGLLRVAAAAAATATADEQTCADGDDEAALLAHKAVKKHQEDTTPATAPPPTPSPAQLSYWAKEWIKLNPTFRNSYSGVFDAPSNADNPRFGFVTTYSCRVPSGGKPFDVQISLLQPLSRQQTAQQVQANVRYMMGSWFAIPNYPVPPGHRVLAQSAAGYMVPGRNSFTLTITSWDGQTLRWKAKGIRMGRVCVDAYGAGYGMFPPPPCAIGDTGADGSFQGDLSFAIQLQ